MKHSNRVPDCPTKTVPPQSWLPPARSDRTGLKRQRTLGSRQPPLPSERYDLILADPEWHFKPRSRETGMDRSADDHYSTNDLEVIATRDIPSIAADNCVLFLWATVPMLPQALYVMDASGFRYNSHVVWVKDRVGTACWFRNEHELLLVGTRGRILGPTPGTQWPSVIVAPWPRHSSKPDVFIEMIEAYFPNLSKVELNRRGPVRPGWAAWGKEVEVS